MPNDLTHSTVCCKGCPDCIGIGVHHQVAELHATIERLTETLRRVTVVAKSPLSDRGLTLLTIQELIANRHSELSNE